MIITELIIVFFTTFILTWVIKKWAIKKNIIDIPNQRSSHTIPTPRGGGLAFFTVWIIIICYLFIDNLISSKLFISLLLVLPIGIISIIDDIISLPATTRLIVQTVCALLVVYNLGGLHPLNLGIIKLNGNNILNIIVVISVIWFINLYNFLDGIDAYASLEAISIALGMFILTEDFLYLFLIASVAGFLFWNWPKAKIFMGDVGSTMLGFTLIVLGIYSNNHHSINIIYWLTLSSLFWFDASVTLIRRKLNHENISKPHKKHAYQRITQAKYSHQRTAILSILINLFFILIVFINSMYIPNIPLLSLILALTINTIIYLFVEKKCKFQ